MSHNPNEGSLPNIYGVTEDMLPAIKDWKNGETYKVEMEILQTRLNDDYSNGMIGNDKADPKSKKLMADFIITSIKPLGSKSTLDKMRKRYVNS